VVRPEPGRTKQRGVVVEPDDREVGQEVPERLDLVPARDRGEPGPRDEAIDEDEARDDRGQQDQKGGRAGPHRQGRRLEALIYLLLSNDALEKVLETRARAD